MMIVFDKYDDKLNICIYYSNIVEFNWIMFTFNLVLQSTISSISLIYLRNTLQK
jgi:hypothetical protein